jgi:NAD(P)-dependent dehydrogenase (short-subunit alcohol dehydrogenase family)
MISPSIVLITGAGSGFGLLTAKILATAGHTVYASMRDISGKNAPAAAEIAAWGQETQTEIHPIELDIASEDSARQAVATILNNHDRLDVLINNAGMLVIGVTEAFTPEQVAYCFDTNVLGLLRVNRAVLPQLRKQQHGLIIYIGSVTSRIISPFQGPYVASKAAGDALAETMHYENTRYGIDSVIIQPGAYTAGTNHFPNAVKPADTDVAAQYDRIAEIPDLLVSRLGSLVPPGTRTDAEEVAEKVRDVIAMEPGTRPFRIVVDPQHHGAAEINEVASQMQADFMRRFGIEDLMRVSQP